MKSNFINIKAKKSLFDLELKEIFKYRDLFYFLIRRDFVSSYKQTILGPVWIVIQALLGSAIFTIIFGEIAGISTDGHPAFLFYLAGNLAWQFFSGVFAIGSNALQSNHNLFSKVYFPRLIPPFAQSSTMLINLLINLLLFAVSAYVYYYKTGVNPSSLNLSVILLPLITLQTLFLGLGLGFILSSISIRYRDLGRLAGLMSQFIMYASPVIYPISLIPDKYNFLISLNPLTFIVETYRFILLGKASGFSIEYAVPSLLITIVLFISGLLLYNKTQRSYVDFV